MQTYILDEHGEPIEQPDLFAWAEWKTTAHARVALDCLEDAAGQPMHVSTIFLGVDFRHFGDGPPILWETMIFGGRLDQQGRRYTSKAAALEGHQLMYQKALAAEREAKGGRDGDRAAE